jgi:hypothetical protein
MAAHDLPRQLQSNNGLVLFPLKMHQLLEATENRGESHIISWLPEGRSFKVHDKEKFTNQIMLDFFGSSKLKTFQRNLNLWGFKTVSKGPEKGECSHPCFLHGLPDLCANMKRVVVRGDNRVSSRQPPNAPHKGYAAPSTPTTMTSSADERSQSNASCLVGNHAPNSVVSRLQTMPPGVGTLDTSHVTALLNHRANALREQYQVATAGSNAFSGQGQDHWAPVPRPALGLREEQIRGAELNAAILNEAVKRLLMGNFRR